MQQRWFEVDGTWVHTVEWEPTTPDPHATPVALVHGLGGSTVNWELVGAALSNRLGATVTAMDLPGFGRTRNTDGPATFESHRHVVKSWLREYGPAIVAGNSMGGSIGVSLAARHPELISGLVLVNAAYPRPTGNFDQLARTAKFAMLTLPRVATPVMNARARRLGSEGLVDATLRFVLAEPDQLDPALRIRLVELAAERNHYPEAAGAYAHSGGTLFRYLVTRMRVDLDTLAMPVMVMHGRQDRLVPVTFARAVARRRPHWQYVELADCGHAPQLEAPDRFVDLVSGWARARRADTGAAPIAPEAPLGGHARRYGGAGRPGPKGQEAQ
jgi:pimeloyl-ACP methyl ester carboxylesterase